MADEIERLRAEIDKWINDLGWTHEQMKDPLINLRFAWLLYSGREANGQCGWTPWSLSC